MKVGFWKAYAEGNSYVIAEAGAPVAALLPWIADSHHGLGGDGLLLADWAGCAGTGAGGTGAGGTGAAEIGMRIFNADGTEAPACGNGARCVAALAIVSGRADGREPVTVRSAGAVIEHRLVSRDGPELTLAQTIALSASPVRWRGGDVVQLDLGTAHRVVFRELDGLDAAAEGPRHCAAWDGGTNVMFTELADDGGLDVVPWERGVGPTLGCATGAAAAVLAALERAEYRDALGAPERGAYRDGPGIASAAPERDGYRGRPGTALAAAQRGRAAGECRADSVMVRQPGGSVLVRAGRDGLDITGTVHLIAEGTVTAR